MEDAKELSKTAGIPIPNTTLVALDTTDMYQAGAFDKVLSDWEDCEKKSKNWEGCKYHFYKAYPKYDKKKKVKSNLGGYEATGNNTPIWKASKATNVEFYNKLDGYMENIANAATNEKVVLEYLNKCYLYCTLILCIRNILTTATMDDK